jgi:hypothetical protein
MSNLLTRPSSTFADTAREYQKERDMSQATHFVRHCIENYAWMLREQFTIELAQSLLGKRLIYRTRGYGLSTEFYSEDRSTLYLLPRNLPEPLPSQSQGDCPARPGFRPTFLGHEVENENDTLRRVLIQRDNETAALRQWLTELNRVVKLQEEANEWQARRIKKLTAAIKEAACGLQSPGAIKIFEKALEYDLA